MDLDAVADELYGLRPEEFVAARDRRARDARGSGDPDLARRIGALRRPNLAAWVSNLLVRGRPEEAGALLGLGEELRRAHRELDGPRLRTLARRQHEVIAALARQAGRLAAEAGHPVGEEVRREVEETLHAVLADPEAAREWAAGRLVRPLHATLGFPAADEATLSRRRTTPAQGPEKRPRGQDRTASATHRRTETHEKARTAERERREREAEAAERELREREREAEAAERELREREREAEAAAREAEEGTRRLAEATDRVRTLRTELRQAEEEQHRARTAEQSARDRTRQADRAAREARRRAEKARAAAGHG
ncbi:hypothetical protein [Streptomyces sp. NPDC127190]|uniref:hypothetical protein n=1 Tax=unclassified Streptomyces TaxID=2593676 RepID=UPI003636C15F